MAPAAKVRSQRSPPAVASRSRHQSGSLKLPRNPTSLFVKRPSEQTRLMPSIVRTAFRFFAGASARPINPGVFEATGPHSSLVLFSISLSFDVAALAILWPIQRKPVPNQPISNIRPIDAADGHHALIPIPIYLDALNGATAYEARELIRRLLATAVQAALFVATKLIRFRRINSK
jgi:hypothetical protein